MVKKYFYSRVRHYYGYWCCSLGYYRMLSGLTQTELGEAVGLTKNSISSIELGHTVPSVKFALRISEIFGLKVDQLFWEEL